MKKLILLLVFVPSLSIAQPLETWELWKKRCVSCHGLEGKGNPKKATVLKIDPKLLDLTRPELKDLTLEEAKKSIWDGKEKMPAYKAKLTEEEVRALTDFVFNNIMHKAN